MVELRFLGIHPPQSCVDEYKYRVKMINRGIPHSKRFRQEFIHISAAYLQGFFEDRIAVDEFVASKLQPLASVLRGTRLHVGGVGVFGEENNPRCVYLQVADNQSLVELNGMVKDVLDESVTRKARPFCPHMTLLRLGDDSLKRRFLDRERMIRAEFGEISWDIPLTALALFGKTPTSCTEILEYIEIGGEVKLGTLST